jgi:hypothetical protein
MLWINEFVVYFHVLFIFLMFLHNWIYNIGFGVVVCTSYLIQHGISQAIWSWRVLFVIAFIGTSDKEWTACHNRIKPTVYGGPTYVENKKIKEFPTIFGGHLICVNLRSIQEERHCAYTLRGLTPTYDPPPPRPHDLRMFIYSLTNGNSLQRKESGTPTTCSQAHHGSMT